MPTLLAYLGVVLIWSTTPLAIKWSGEGPGFLFGVMARMSLGLAIAGSIRLFSRQSLPMDRAALRTYLAGSLHIYGTMLAVYWSAQFIPSGWVSVVFGLTPLLTAPMARIWLGERSLTPLRLLAYGVGFAGLFVIFRSAVTLSEEATLSIAGVLLAATLQAGSAVWVKRINARLPPMTQVTGSLCLAVPAYWITWALLDGAVPETLPITALGSILYLGIVATLLGFTLYYHVIQHLPATRVALITLITPLFSLYLGHVANHEPLHRSFMEGTALILGALLLYQWGGGIGYRTGLNRLKRPRFQRGRSD